MIEKEILENYINKELSYKEIAKIFNVNEKTIKINAKKYGLTSKIGSQGARKHKFNERYFENIDSEEKAYWLGFIAADGCVYKNKQSYRLQINLKGSDIDHLKKFQKAICSDYKITEKKVGKAQSNTCQLKINSTKMCNDLIKNNIIERKSIIFEPPILNKNLMNHFIRGYFDGDGCICVYKVKFIRNNHKYINTKCCINIVGTEQFLTELKKILENNNIKCNSKLYKRHKERFNNIRTLMISGKQNCKSFYKFAYKDSNVFLLRKYEKFKNIN